MRFRTARHHLARARILGRLIWVAFRHADRPALSVGEVCLSYRQLWTRIWRLSQILRGYPAGSVGLISHRSLADYTVMLAAWLSGRCYVPVSTSLARKAQIAHLQRCGVTLVTSAKPKDRVISDELGCAFIDISDPLPRRRCMRAWRLAANPTAYVMATSGTSGPSKAVPIGFAQLHAYLKAASRALSPHHSWRMSQVFDLSFDLSLHDILIAFSNGAHLSVARRSDLTDLPRYVTSQRITHWFSTPSHAELLLARARDTNALASLQHAMFCGEALTWDLAQRFRALTACPLENWYGPTEATIAATRFALPETMPHHGVVPIGWALDRVSTSVASDGRLLLAGPQVFEGYLGQNQTANAYDTGDLVAMDKTGVFHFQGRTDDQVKISGHGIALCAVEAEAFALMGHTQVIAVPWPHSSPNPETLRLIAFSANPAPKVLTLTTSLPSSFPPLQVFRLPVAPLTPSGKIDRAKASALAANHAVARVKDRPKRRYDAVLNLSTRAKPGVSTTLLLRGATLIEAGFDSLSILRFAHLIEEKYNVALSAQSLAALPSMSLRQVTKLLRTRLETSPNNAVNLDRAHRAFSFLEAFPNVLKTTPRPLIPCIGSSGFMRAIYPPAIQHPVGHVVNIGLPYVSALGLSEISQFVQETATYYRRRFPITVVELELMQLSKLPAAGEVEVLEAFRAGLRPRYCTDINPEFRWDAQHMGAIETPHGPRRPPLPWTGWEQRRHIEFKSVFSGNVAFDAPALAQFAHGIRALSKASDCMVVVLHPLDRFASSLCDGVGHLADVLSLLDRLPIDHVLTDQSFGLTPSDFRNFSHLNAMQGSVAFSRQLGHLLRDVAPLTWRARAS